MAHPPLLWHLLRNPDCSTPECLLVPKLQKYAPNVAAQLEAVSWGYGRECSVPHNFMQLPSDWKLFPKHQSVAGMADILSKLLTPQQLLTWELAEPNHPWPQLIRLAYENADTPLHLVDKHLEAPFPEQAPHPSWTWLAGTSVHRWTFLLQKKKAPGLFTPLHGIIRFTAKDGRVIERIAFPLSILPRQGAPFPGHRHLGSVLFGFSEFASHPAAHVPAYIHDNQLDIQRAASQLLNTSTILGWTIDSHTL